MIQFFAPDIATSLQLPESDSKHAVRVLRLAEGSMLSVIDGAGHLYECRLVDAHPKHAAVEIVSCQDAPLPWPQQLAVAVAPTKHMDRMEWMVEKLTEIGVNRIIPILTQRSERKELKVERLEKIAISAMKQSLKAVLPEVLPLTPLRDVIRMMPEAQRFVAYCDKDTPRVDLAKAYTPQRDSLILIGPEGDFTPSEIADTLQAGFTAVTLGENRLRTETAALYAITVCHVADTLKI